MNKKLTGIRFWILVAVLFIFLRLPSLFEPYWYGDEAIYLVLGQAINKGVTLYSQIHDNKPPSLYYLAALAKTVFGFRFLLYVWMIPTTYYFYKLCQKFFQPYQSKICLLLFIFLSNIPLIEGNIANSEIFMLLPTILSFYFFDPKKIKSFFISGLCLGLAFTLKSPAFFELLVLLFILFSDYLVSIKSFSKLGDNIIQILNKASILILGFISPSLIYALVFFFKGALPEYLYATFLQNLPYLSSWQTGNHSGSPFQSGLLIRGLILLFFWITCFLLLKKKKISNHVFFLLIWLSTTLFSVLLSTRPYPHYLIQMIPCLCLSVTYLFFKKDKITTFLFFSIFSTFIFSLIHYKFYFYKTISYYQTFYTELLNQGKFTNFFGEHVFNNQQIIDYLNANHVNDESVFVWGDAPFIYAKLNILPPTKYVVAYHIADFNQYDLTLAELRSRLPIYIVYYPMSTRPFVGLDDILSKYYRLDNQIKDVLIYQKI